MCKITSLPDDVIVIILGYDEISIEDIKSFTSTCTRFQNILSNYNKFWEKNYYKRCPTAKKIYDIKKKEKIFGYLSFERKIETSLTCIKNLQYYAFLMSGNNFKQKEKRKLNNHLRSIAEDSMTYYFVLDELDRIISEQLQCQPDSNLTMRYNFGLLYYCLKNYRLTYKLIKFLKKPKEKQLLEQLPTIVLQYYLPQVSYSVIRTWLNNITQEILFRLPKKYLEHSSMSFEQLSFRMDNNIYENYWNPTEVQHIMSILEEFIFSELDLNELLITLDINGYMDYYDILAPFLESSLSSIIFHSVARRLGIHCALIAKLNSIMILWNPKYETEDFKYTDYLYCMNDDFDEYYPSNIIREKCGGFVPMKIENNAILRLTQYMMCQFIEILEDMDDIYFKHCILLNDLYKTEEVKDINIKSEYSCITKLMEIKSCIREQSTIKRTKQIKYAVGMIVTYIYTFNSEKNTGVIVGWHTQCDSMFNTKLRDTFMFPYLRRRNITYEICFCQKYFDSFNRPHYIILTEDDTICYVRQDFILSISPSPNTINNIEIGKYFSKFEGTYYVPNERLAKQYPNDTAVLLNQFSNQ